ncbi:MAG: hypothetical protein E5X67_21310 [Mesorhizobium sp.]|uniref:hypothetical protein n=1 Tax=Mesorhizobium sp. TaxID=1871066 RepID=UPI001216031E|nr:hypothetical protein [Mesorhizobium sp.]TIP26204.1 MAG: hypothetical protein E5X67_21310 [Mesorhizobium sp.]
MNVRRQYTLYRLPFPQSDQPWNWLIAGDPGATRAEAEKARQEAGSVAVVHAPGWRTALIRPILPARPRS